MLGTVYINTDINPNIFNTQELVDLHIPISVAQNPVLKYDSHVDCSQIIERKKELVYNIINSGDNKFGYVGNISPKDLGNIRNKLIHAPTIAPIIKKKYGLI